MRGWRIPAASADAPRPQRRDVPHASSPPPQPERIVRALNASSLRLSSSVEHYRYRYEQPRTCPCLDFPSQPNPWLSVSPSQRVDYSLDTLNNLADNSRTLEFKESPGSSGHNDLALEADEDLGLDFDNMKQQEAKFSETPVHPRLVPPVLEGNRRRRPGYGRRTALPAGQTNRLQRRMYPSWIRGVVSGRSQYLKRGNGNMAFTYRQCFFNPVTCFG
ncbi:unnamed protein product [Cyprideis torosa]|uniref:Uncharacterized protein n=1 Tax=Cyprideis torosa TaxID=163714 RepID=A0A7R8WCV6_9CRUS|nr:unnamed protein product [Cyprideis torosa]CAG0893937.1 unnamed protein product [Cyprideis torosa]